MARTSSEQVTMNPLRLATTRQYSQTSPLMTGRWISSLVITTGYTTTIPVILIIRGRGKLGLALHLFRLICVTADDPSWQQVQFAANVTTVYK